MSPRLVWYPESGYGTYPVEPNVAPYDADYFAKYEAYAKTELGRRLLAYRLELVERFAAPSEVYLKRGGAHATVTDIGIGCGAFVEARREYAETFGYDTNPVGLAWLHNRGWYRDPMLIESDALTFWDSLEHIPDPCPLLRQARMHFVSLPIFTGPEHVVRSKHFRPTEHCWYFTREGLLSFFANLDFRCLEHSTVESLLGREDIHTFVFARP